MAESPPPMTAISLPEKKKPSQVAQDETPCPMSAFSLGRPSQRAEAPLATINARVNKVSRTEVHGNGLGSRPSLFWLRSTLTTWPVLNSAPKRVLLAHVVDEFRALDAVGESGKVFDQGGEGQLAARFVSFDDEGLRLARAA